MSLIFISYRREDSAGYAGRLHESLERRFGQDEVFRDADTLEPGQDFVDAITARLRHCRACLVLIGHEWLNARDASGVRRLDQESDYVRLEIAAALARPDVLVIPVLVEGENMPASNQLPEAIRTLARRQAASLRDDAWDVDVDRLARTLQKALGSRSPQGDLPASAVSPLRTGLAARSNLKWAGLALLLLTSLVLMRVFWSPDREATVPGTTPTPATLDGSAAATPIAQAIAIPRVAEVAHGSVIHTLLSGGVASNGSEQMVRLRVRFSNEGRYPANFWDSSFRLAVRGQVLEPTSDLNEVVGGHAITQGVVTFEVPSAATEATLRVMSGDDTAEVPLDLRPTGASPTVDTMDTSDALSRAIVAPLVQSARPVGSGKEVSYTLASATARRFANTLRIFLDVRMTNHGRYPSAFSADAIRLLADGQLTPPFEGPNDVVQPEATAAGTYVFDIPPSVRRIVLRLTAEPRVELALDLPDTLR